MTENLDHDHIDTPDLATDNNAYSVEDVLGMAELLERTATVCLKANLQGEWDRLLDELKGLVTATGEVIDSDERSAGEKSSASRALEIQDRLNVLRGEMRKSLWHVTFRAMPSDDWSSFVKRHKPKAGAKDQKPDLTDFFNRLIAETAVSPTLTRADVVKLRKTLSTTAITNLMNTAWSVCTEGGIDAPKLPVSLLNLVGGSSED